jgi:hypothetical protein
MSVEPLTTLGAFISAVWDVTVAALLLRPDAITIDQAQSGPVILAVALAGSVSLMLGQSAVLFINRLTPRQLVLSVIVNAAIFVIGLVIWAAAIWLSAYIVLDINAPLAEVVRCVGLGCAPFLFGILIFLPYAGPLIARILYTWSLLIVLNAVSSALHAGLLPSLICVGVGWLLVLWVGNTVARPVVRARDWIQRRAVGRVRLMSLEETLTGHVEDNRTGGVTGGGR